MDVSVVIVWVLFLLKALIGLVANFAIIALGWFMMWHLHLRHMPLVQEILGLNPRPKPETQRL